MNAPDFYRADIAFPALPNILAINIQQAGALRRVQKSKDRRFTTSALRPAFIEQDRHPLAPMCFVVESSVVDGYSPPRGFAVRAAPALPPELLLLPAAPAVLAPAELEPPDVDVDGGV